jgi:hypothetical protein
MPSARRKRTIHQLWISCLLLLASVLLARASDLKYLLLTQDAVMEPLMDAP